MNRIVVKIANQEYSITGDEEKDYILSLASYVDEQIKIAVEKSPRVNSVTPAILAAINITDQYFKQREKNKELSNQLTDDCLGKDEWNQKNNQLIDEQNDSINKLYDRIQKLDNILVVKDKEIHDINLELNKKILENEELNNLLNQFQDEIYELQMQLMSKKDK